ncbi:MAG: F0F1 ATP synthase subunit B [Oscillospiraceae bacterium]|jgi:F-type H+-transporting ATPase subunit b|nr:F0F1 ATP synthase subunit B [Oscillospiraceae bacterium]
MSLLVTISDLAPAALDNGVFELVNFTAPTAYFTLANTAIITIAYFIFLHKPVMNMLEKRKADVNSDIDAAKAAKERAETAERDYMSKIADSKEEARKIVESAKKNGQTKYDELLAEAAEAARITREKGEADVKRERKATLNTLKNQITELVIDAASAVTGKEITADNNVELIDGFLKQADNIQ